MRRFVLPVIALLTALGACSDPPRTRVLERADVVAPAGPSDAKEDMRRERAGVALVRSDARDAWMLRVGERVVVDVPWKADTLGSVFFSAAVVAPPSVRNGLVRLTVRTEGSEPPWWQAEIDLAKAPAWHSVAHKLMNGDDQLGIELSAEWVGAPPAGADGVRAAFEPPRAARARPRAPAMAPNVLILTVDTLRSDRLGCYGYKRPTSPHLDALAARGTRFAAAYSSAPWTLPSYGSLFTGLYPGEHRAGVITERDARFGLDEDAPKPWTTEKLCGDVGTLAERFTAAGWATAMLHNNPYLSRASGLERGFERYVSYGSNAKNGVDLALEQIDGVRAGPWLLVLHLMDPHFPYAPPAPYDAQFAKKSVDDLASWPPDLGALRAARPTDGTAELSSDLYDGEIAFTDAQIGRLLDELAQRGLLDSTIVVLHSDHGEEFWEHGSCDHGHTQNDELLRVPVVVAWPGKVPAGRVVEERVRALDLHATLLELAGIAVPEGLESRSLRPLFTASAPARTAISEAVHGGPREIKAVLDGAMKLVQRGTELHLYDLAGDPLEATDLAARDAARTAALRALLEAHQKRTRAAADCAEALNLDDAARGRLRDTGYGGDGHDGPR